MSRSIVSRKAKIAVGVLVVAAIVWAIEWLPVLPWLRDAIAWTHRLGPTGLAMFSLLYVVVCLAMLPSFVFYIAAGALYGTLWGGLLMIALGGVVELCTLWLVHTRLRDDIERRLDEHPKIAALDRAISEHSFSIVLLLRISPLVPFAPMNYALALTKMPLWQRIVTNAVGMAPTVFAQSYIGSLLSGVRRLAHAHAPPLWEHVLLWSGIATAIAAVVIVTWATRRILARDGDTRRESHA